VSLAPKTLAFRRAALEQRQLLQRLDCRARIDRPRHIAERQHRRAVGVNHRHGATMAAFRERTPHPLAQHRITHLSCCPRAPGGPLPQLRPKPFILADTMDQPPPRSPRKLMVFPLLALFLLPVAARAALFAYESGPRSWRDADWSCTGTLPAAPAHPA